MAGPVFEILLVDDEPGDVELAKLALAEGPYACNVTVALDGCEALAVLRRDAPHDRAPTPDLVLLDLNLPKMTGREVLAAMRADPDLAALPVVVLTTSDAERDVEAVYDLGASGFLTKPVSVDELFKAIHAVEEYWFGTVRRPHHP